MGGWQGAQPDTPRPGVGRARPYAPRGRSLASGCHCPAPSSRPWLAHHSPQATRAQKRRRPHTARFGTMHRATPPRASGPLGLGAQCRSGRPWLLRVPGQCRALPGTPRRTLFRSPPWKRKHRALSSRVRAGARPCLEQNLLSSVGSRAGPVSCEALPSPAHGDSYIKGNDFKAGASLLARSG